MTDNTARLVWVFCHRCGCPFGVMDVAPGQTEGEAMADFYDNVGDLVQALGRGVTAERMDHRRYAVEVSPQMLSDFVCPHAEVRRPEVNR